MRHSGPSDNVGRDMRPGGGFFSTFRILWCCGKLDITRRGTTLAACVSHHTQNGALRQAGPRAWQALWDLHESLARESSTKNRRGDCAGRTHVFANGHVNMHTMHNIPIHETPKQTHLSMAKGSRSH